MVCPLCPFIGVWLCGLLVSGELFLWNRDKDLLKTAPAVPEILQLVAALQGRRIKKIATMHTATFNFAHCAFSHSCCICVLTGNATRLSLQVSGDGLRVLVVAVTGQVFLWECTGVQDLAGVRDGVVRGRWSQVHPLEDSILPSAQDKEASQHTIFVKTEVSMLKDIFGHVACFTFCISPFNFSVRIWVILAYQLLFSPLG